MTDGWLPIFDQSFNRVPVTKLRNMYLAGYRVMAGYAGGGSSAKWLTRAEISAWRALGPDTGVLALFEVKGTEPIDNPTSGDDHAKEARAAWRVLGYPDAGTISPAVDENVTVAEARAQLTTYMGHWAVADTTHPLAYVEMDAGAVLFMAGVTIGTGTPAAFSWDNSGKLVTPANAPAHVLWTQEHNGQRLAGGIVDIGHIRTTAPIWWTTAHTDGGDMATTLTPDDLKNIRNVILNDPAFADLTWREHGMVNMLDTYQGGSSSVKGQPVKIVAALKDLAAAIEALSGAAPGTPEDPEVIADAVADELADRLKTKPATT